MVADYAESPGAAILGYYRASLLLNASFTPSRPQDDIIASR